MWRDWYNKLKRSKRQVIMVVRGGGSKAGYIFDLFSEKARSIINIAVAEARHLGWRSVTPEHLLLALLKDENNKVKEFLLLNKLGYAYEPNGVTISYAGSVAGIFLPRKSAASQDRDIQPTDQFYQVINEALEVCYCRTGQLGRPEDLLLGLLLEGTSRAAWLLHRSGVNEKKVRQCFVFFDRGPKSLFKRLFYHS